MTNAITKDYLYEVSAAGRVNLIGEHIDYCGGKVMPAALSLRNTVYIRPNNTNKINLKWTTLSDEVSLDIDKLSEYKNLKYGNYQAGSAYIWKSLGHKISGCDMLYECTVPFGSGLSSSAAIEVSTIAALALLAGEPIEPEKIAIAAQKAEHDYVGVNCGIMDQYASACGKSGHVMLLDCNTLECAYLPFNLKDYSLMLVDCNKPHNLITSKYNERRAETDEALSILNKKTGLKSLCDLTYSTFKKYSIYLNKTLRKRVEHVVTENERVKQAELALRAGNIEFLGRLLNLSHYSLKSLYEVTGREPDALVEAARTHCSCIGARLTGGGFGGCIVAIVKKNQISSFKEHTYQAYKSATGYEAKFYDVKISDGIVVKKL